MKRKNIIIIVTIVLIFVISATFIEFNFVHENKIMSHLENKIFSQRIPRNESFNLNLSANSLTIEKQINNDDIKTYVYSLISKKLDKKIYGHAIYKKVKFLNYYEPISFGSSTEDISYSQYMINKNRYLILLYGINAKHSVSTISFEINDKVFKEDIKGEDIFIRMYNRDKESDIRVIR
ncbi:MAG: hypothetical protein MJA82_13135 [Clostridia bacterium]|nr:hypothetical protein [Clostridia bacterium]